MWLLQTIIHLSHDIVTSYSHNDYMLQKDIEDIALVLNCILKNSKRIILVLEIDRKSKKNNTKEE